MSKSACVSHGGGALAAEVSLGSRAPSPAQRGENTMKGLLLLTVGVAAGFVVAHQVAKTPQGKQFFEDVDAKAREFGSAVVDGYKSRESELRDAAGDLLK
jgi:hypothetical protein